MNFFEDLDYIWWRFFAILIVSVLSFYWLWKSGNAKKKYYFIPFIVFIFIYSGAGFGWETCDNNYFWKYSLYFVVFGFSCYLAQRDKVTSGPSFELKNTVLSHFFKKHGSKIVWFYIALKFFTVVINGHALNIIRPPQVDMSSMIEGSYQAKSALATLAWYLDNIVYVFYLVSLYNYRKKFGSFCFYLMLPVYLEYADVCYLGRGTIMLTLINLAIGFILCYPQYKKTVITAALISAPFIVFALVWFSGFRMGVTLDDVDTGRALQILSYQETSYPLHYNSIKLWGFDPDVCYAYLYWLVTLPFPGFFRSENVDVYFNYIFSERINGTVRGGQGFSVSLPGLVNEGIFVFGPTFFIIHALILGFFVGKAYKWVRYSPELFLFVHCCVDVPYLISRGGTASQYSFYLKNFLIYLIVRYIILSSTSRKTNVHQ